MRHIALTGYGQAPCGGEVVVEAAAPRAGKLPVLGQAAPATQVWVCQRCAQRWSREPQPEEAL